MTSTSGQRTTTIWPGTPFLSALLLPGLLIAFYLGPSIGLTAPGALDFERARALAAHPLGLAVLGTAAASCLFNAAHHFRHLCVDLGFGRHSTWIAKIVYGAALTGTTLTGVAIMRLT